MDYTEYALYYGPEAAERAVREQQAQQNWAGETAGERMRRLIEEQGFSEWVPMVGRTDQVDWDLWAQQSRRPSDEATDLRNWFTDKPNVPRTITLQPGDYRWSDAPKYRLHPDAYADITDGLRLFESRSSRPTGVAMNLATGQAFADLYARIEVTPDSVMSIFGIPVAIEAEVPTGVLRIRNMWTTSDVTLREAPAATAAAPKPPTSWDPAPKWRRDHETQWWGTYGNPLLRPTGI